MSKKLLMNNINKEKNSNELFAIVDKLLGRNPGYYSFNGEYMELYVYTASGHQRYFITKDSPTQMNSTWYDSSTHTNLQGIFNIKQGDIVKIEYVQLEGGSSLNDFKSAIEKVGFNTNKNKVYSSMFNDLGYMEFTITEDDIFNTTFIGAYVGKNKLLNNFTFKIYLNDVLIQKFKRGE